MKLALWLFLAGNVIPLLGVALLLYGRRQRRLGHEIGAARGFWIGLTAYASVWGVLMIPWVYHIVGLWPSKPDVMGALLIALVDLVLVYIFLSISRRRKLLADERLRAQQLVDEVERQGA
jgi:drug/metabolite transporter superfamily protein YnfA